MPNRPRLRLHRLQALHDVKIKNLAKAIAKKTSIDARVKRLQDSVEYYREAIAKERRNNLREGKKKRKRSSSESDTSDEAAGQMLAIEDKPHARAMEWAPGGISCA